jgi:hypothetical protein
MKIKRSTRKAYNREGKIKDQKPIGKKISTRTY